VNRAIKSTGIPVQKESAKAGPPEPATKRILVVDDDSSVREMLTRVLAGEGYQALSAASGEEALKFVAVSPFDLVLLDLNMPGKNGWDTFERLTTENPLLAVIIITAKPNQLFTALSAGAGALLEKPLDFPKLLETVTQLLAESGEARLARIAGKAAEFYYMPTQQK
jgi:CheY-like chemotaxis protein